MNKVLVEKRHLHLSCFSLSCTLYDYLETVLYTHIHLNPLFSSVGVLLSCMLLCNCGTLQPTFSTASTDTLFLTVYWRNGLENELRFLLEGKLAPFITWQLLLWQHEWREVEKRRMG